MKERKRNMKARDYRAVKSLYSGGLRTDLKEAPVCPYCGAKMKLMGAKEQNSKYEDQLRYVCPTEDCNCSARAQVINGSLMLISTPANRQLRNLRNEAHFWIQKLTETGVISDKQGVAYYLSNTITTGASRYVHVGSCREAGCMDIIRACVKKLYENREKFEPFEGYNFTCTYKEEELWEMVKTISRRPRR